MRTPSEVQLLDLLAARSFKRGEFNLASGDKSTYYIDGKMTEVCSEGAYLLGEVIYERTCHLPIDAIGGLEAGAIPLATAAAISYRHHDRSIEGYWVRDAAKGHGTKKRVEGSLKPGSRVVVLDDVITRGTSSLRAIEAVRELGCEVVLVLAIVDRLQGAEQIFKETGIRNYQSVFTIRDFGIEVIEDALRGSAVASR